MRSRILAGVVLLIATWPAVHFVLTQTLGTNPWQLYGFAMYCTYRGRTRVLIVDATTGQRAITDLSDEERREFAGFQDRAHILGRRLASPDRMARLLMSNRPKVQRLVVVVFDRRLDTENDRLEDLSSAYEYLRRGRNVERGRVEHR